MDSGLLKRKRTNRMWATLRIKGKAEEPDSEGWGTAALKIQVAGTSTILSGSCCGMDDPTISPSLFVSTQDKNSWEIRAD